MEREESKCDISINAIASLEVSRRDLVRLRDQMGALEARLERLQREENEIRSNIFEMARVTVEMKSLFLSAFESEIAGVPWIEEEKARVSKPRPSAHVPEKITLGISEITRAQILSVMDAIKLVSKESQGHAPRDAVKARVEEIGIGSDDFEEVLQRLRRAGALIEMEGMLKLI